MNNEIEDFKRKIENKPLKQTTMYMNKKLFDDIVTKVELNDNICLYCKGTGEDPIQNGGLTKVCRICGGNGQRPIDYDKKNRHKSFGEFKLQPDVMFMSEKNWKEMLEWSKEWSKEEGKKNL